MKKNMSQAGPCGIFINEILVFVQEKMYVVNDQTMRIICHITFTEDDIESAKSVLSRCMPEKNIGRRVREGKKKRIKTDIIKIV